MNTTETARIILTEALDFMARKAGTTRNEIMDSIEADPAGNTARYLTQLLVAGARFATA